jgi:hypothetical protein
MVSATGTDHVEARPAPFQSSPVLPGSLHLGVYEACFTTLTRVVESA